MKNKITIREIAKIMNISHTTVSRALNDSDLVTEETKNKIKEVAQAYGYQMNYTARSLATGIKMTIGILYPSSKLRQNDSWYTSTLISLIRKELEKEKIDCIISGYDTTENHINDICRLVTEQKVDGLMILGHEITKPVIDVLNESTKNLLFINPNPKLDLSNFNRIIIDDLCGGQLVANKFRNLNIEDIIIISQDTGQFKKRIKGFTNEIQKIKDISDPLNIDTIFVNDSEIYSLRQTLNSKLHLFKNKKAIFALSDRLAFGTCNILSENNYSIPSDFEVIGYDDIEWCEYFIPTLTSVHQPRFKVAKIASRIMKKRILEKDYNVECITLKPKLICRNSTK
ncbi:MAG: LacI family DNA-binding transcriptional regulator [Sphaerochaetaceae bacterium]|nr:LacI family DNA-binding transcriptional regulator [Sphaerochaetaceae bacterium]